MGAYSYTLSETVAEFALDLEPSEQTNLVSLFRQLATDPYQEGEFTDVDRTGRTLQVKLFGHWLVTYWPDHGANEVRIVDMTQV